MAAAGQEVSLGQACPQGCTSGEGRAEKEGMQEPPKAVTCWRKRWGKDLGDISLKSGRLSREEPA